MTFMTRYYHRFKLSRRLFSVLHIRLNIRPVLLALAVLFIVSCEEDPTRIGQELLPSNEFVKISSTDTLSVFSYTNYDPSFRTELPDVSYLGSLYDPYFGSTTGEFVTEIRLGGVWDDKPFTIDSVKLYLRILDPSRNTLIKHTLRISEIDKQLSVDSVYYSNTPVPLTGYSVSGIELPVLDSVINNVAIDLPVEFGQYLTRDTSWLFYSATRPDFRSFFNGLYFQMEPSPDPLTIALSLAAPATLGDNRNFIALFMHDDAGIEKVFYFILDATNRNASFNRVIHDHSTGIPGKKIPHINDGYKDTLTYNQYLNGTYTKLTFPGLEDLKNDTTRGRIVVNKAVLTVPLHYDGDLYIPSAMPEQMLLRYETNLGAKFIVPEYNYDQFHNFFGGAIDTIKNVYTFNIPGYFQNYFDDKTGRLSPELELFQQSGRRNAILKANNSKTPVGFTFTFTEF